MAIAVSEALRPEIHSGKDQFITSQLVKRFEEFFMDSNVNVSFERDPEKIKVSRELILTAGSNSIRIGENIRDHWKNVSFTSFNRAGHVDMTNILRIDFDPEGQFVEFNGVTGFSPESKIPHGEDTMTVRLHTNGAISGFLLP